MKENTIPLPGDPDRRTLPELCEALERAESTIYRYLDQGMPSYRVLGSRVFRWSEVLAWIEARTLEDAAP